MVTDKYRTVLNF